MPAPRARGRRWCCAASDPWEPLTGQHQASPSWGPRSSAGRGNHVLHMGTRGRLDPGEKACSGPWKRSKDWSGRSPFSRDPSPRPGTMLLRQQPPTSQVSPSVPQSLLLPSRFLKTLTLSDGGSRRWTADSPMCCRAESPGWPCRLSWGPGCSAPSLHWANSSALLLTSLGESLKSLSWVVTRFSINKVHGFLTIKITHEIGDNLSVLQLGACKAINHVRHGVCSSLPVARGGHRGDAPKTKDWTWNSCWRAPCTLRPSQANRRTRPPTPVTGPVLAEEAPLGLVHWALQLWTFLFAPPAEARMALRGPAPSCRGHVGTPGAALSPREPRTASLPGCTR